MPDHTLTGNIIQHTHFRSEILRNERTISVYLPRGYRRNRTARYPVFYLHDGQNVFDAATAFGGVEWGVDETAQRLIRKNLMEATIIVAVDNVGENRIHEYTPTRGIIDDSGKRKKRSKGLGRKFGRFIVEEVKPFIDKVYRTRPEPEFTGLGGSSLGGLSTLVLGLWFPHVFTRLAVMSASIWWDNCVIYDMVDAIQDGAKPPLRIWLDTGTHEPGWERAAVLRDKLLAKGWRLYGDLNYLEAEGADHSEGAWAARVEQVLRFLYPPRPKAARMAPAPIVVTAGAI